MPGLYSRSRLAITLAARSGSSSASRYRGRHAGSPELCVNNSRAVLEALFNKQSEFVRTPKYHIEGDADEWVGKRYRQSVAVQPLIELALGLYFTATVFYALANQIYGTVPFLVLFQVGFLYTGLLSVVQQYAGDGVSVPKLEVRT